MISFPEQVRNLLLPLKNRASIAKCCFDDALCASEAFGSLARLLNETKNSCVEG